MCFFVTFISKSVLKARKTCFCLVLVFSLPPLNRLISIGSAVDTLNVIQFDLFSLNAIVLSYSFVALVVEPFLRHCLHFVMLSSNLFPVFPIWFVSQ